MSVKNMPEYDPDAKIHSLALTVPSWVDAIEHAWDATNFNEVSDSAYRGLEKELALLTSTIGAMLATITEKRDEREGKQQVRPKSSF